MAIVHFNEYKVVRIFEQNQTMKIGGFNSIKHGELKHIRPLIYINDTQSLVGTEKIKISLYADEYLQKKYIDSDLISISNISSTDPDYNTDWGWLGFVRFDFDRYFINKNNTYYLGATISDYTPSGSMYISMVYDWPDTIYNNGGVYFSEYSISMQIYMFEGPN